MAELAETLAGLIEQKSGMREAILRDVPKAKFHPQKPDAGEMVKQVELVAHFLGREVADYFSQTNETMLALRRGIGLGRLVELTKDEGPRTKEDRPPATDDLSKATTDSGACFERERSAQAPVSPGAAPACRREGGCRPL